MALYHFSAKVIQRSQGRSAVAAAAYRAAEELHDGSVKNLGRYAASWIAGWPNCPSSTAALTWSTR
jgi:hypothetical protein